MKLKDMHKSFAQIPGIVVTRGVGVVGESLQAQGGTRSIHDGGSDVFFWVENFHARYFFGSRDLSCIFLGLKKIRIFFWVLSPSELFVSGFRCDQWIRKIFIRTFFQRRVFRVLVFFWVGNFDARYFFGYKISGLCIFLGLQYEAPSDPPVMYTSSTPPWVSRLAFPPAIISPTYVTMLQYSHHL